MIAPAEIPAQDQGIPKPIKFLLSRHQLAAALSISLASLDRLVKAGSLPAPIRLGHRPLWSPETIQKWIAAQESAEISLAS